MPDLSEIIDPPGKITILNTITLKAELCQITLCSSCEGGDCEVIRTIDQATDRLLQMLVELDLSNFTMRRWLEVAGEAMGPT